MQITNITDEGLSREYALEWSNEQIDTQLSNLIASQYSHLQVPGFRPGKAPIQVIKQRVGPSLIPDTLEGLLKEGIAELIDQKQLKDIINTNNYPDHYHPGGAFKVRITFDLKPEIKPMDFSSIKLVEYKPTTPEATLEKLLKNIAKRNGEKTEVKRKAKSGDVVIIDFEGFKGGEAFAGGKGENAELEIGSNTFIPGFEDQFIGQKAEDKVEFDITFPEDYQAADLAGQQVRFFCTVHKVMELKERTIDDELAKELGLENLDELKKRVTESYENGLKEQTQEILRIELMDILNDAHQFELPPRMVEQEFDQIWQQIKHALDNGQLDPEDQDKDEETLKAEYTKIAERRVKLGMLLSDVAERSEVKINEQETERYMIERVTKMPPEQQSQYLQLFNQDKAGLIRMFGAELLESKAIDFICEQAQIDIKEVDEDGLRKILETRSNEEKQAKKQSKDKPKPAKKAKPKAKETKKKKDE